MSGSAVMLLLHPRRTPQCAAAALFGLRKPQKAGGAGAGALFKEAGFEPADKLLASSTKVLSFRKPAASPAARQPTPQPSAAAYVPAAVAV